VAALLRGDASNAAVFMAMRNARLIGGDSCIISFDSAPLPPGPYLVPSAGLGKWVLVV
jgi:hypothetical protein